MKIYEVAVLFVPEEKKNEDMVEKPMLLVRPIAILAKNDAAAQIQAARMIPVNYEDRLEQIQVVVRPF